MGHTRKYTSDHNEWRPVTLSSSLRDAPDTSPAPMVTSYLQVTNITFSHRPTGNRGIEATGPTFRTSQPEVGLRNSSTFASFTTSATTTLQPSTFSTTFPSSPGIVTFSTENSRHLESSQVTFSDEENEFPDEEFSATFSSESLRDSQGIIGELNHLGVTAVGDNVQVSETGDNNFILTLQHLRPDGTQVPLELLISVDGRLISSVSSLSSTGIGHRAQSRKGLGDSELTLKELPLTVKRYVEELKNKTDSKLGISTQDDVHSSSGLPGQLSLNYDKSGNTAAQVRVDQVKNRSSRPIPAFLHPNKSTSHPILALFPTRAKGYLLPQPSRLTNLAFERQSSPASGLSRSSSVDFQDEKPRVNTKVWGSPSERSSISHREDTSVSSLHPRFPRPAKFHAQPNTDSFIPTHGSSGTLLKLDSSSKIINQKTRSNSSKKKLTSQLVSGSYSGFADWWPIPRLFQDRSHVNQDDQRKKVDETMDASSLEVVTITPAQNEKPIANLNADAEYLEASINSSKKRPEEMRYVTRESPSSLHIISALLANSTASYFGKNPHQAVLSNNFTRNGTSFSGHSPVHNDDSREAKRKTTPVFSFALQNKAPSRTIRDVGAFATQEGSPDTKVRIRLKVVNDPSELGNILSQNKGYPRQLVRTDHSFQNIPSKSVNPPVVFTQGHLPTHAKTIPSSYMKGTELYLVGAKEKVSFPPMATSSSSLLPQWLPAPTDLQRVSLLAHPVTKTQVNFSPPAAYVTPQHGHLIAAAPFSQNVYPSPRPSYFHFPGNQAQHQLVLAPVTRQAETAREVIVTPLFPPTVLVASHRERPWGVR